jgi:hypothetical protein
MLVAWFRQPGNPLMPGTLRDSRRDKKYIEVRIDKVIAPTAPTPTVHSFVAQDLERMMSPDMGKKLP